MTIQGRGAAGGAAVPGGLKALIFVPSSAEFRVLEGVVAELLAAGHSVLVVFNERSSDRSAEDRRRLDELHEQQARFEHTRVRPRTGMWGTLASALRRTLDYARYLEPEHADAELPRKDARARAPRGARLLLSLPPFRWAVGRHPLVWVLGRVEAGIPLPRDVKSLVSQQQPDLLLVLPQADSASGSADYLRAASAARVPSLFVVTDGDDAPSVEAIENAARGEVSPMRAGRLMKPLLWLLSPVLALLFVILRPRASCRAAIKGARRLPKRIRRRTRTRGRTDAEHTKALAVAARQEKLAQAETARQHKAERARLKAERGRKRERQAGDSAANGGDSAANGGDSASREAAEPREQPHA